MKRKFQDDPQPPFYLFLDPQERDRALLNALADEREARQAVATTSRWYNPEPHRSGVWGEWSYSVLTGQPMNVSPEISDRGEDFPGVDVKTSTHWHGEPHLKVSDVQGFKARYYFAVRFDPEKGLVHPLGYATREMLQQAPTRRYGKEHGAAHYIPAHKLLSADAILARYFAQGIFL